MSQIFATREEQAPKPEHLNFPRGASKQAQTTEANRKGTSSSETEALVPKNTVQTVSKPSPSPKIDRLRNGESLRNRSFQQNHRKRRAMSLKQQEDRIRSTGRRRALGLFRNRSTDTHTPEMPRERERKQRQRFGDEHDRHRDSSGAWRPIRRAGP